MDADSDRRTVRGGRRKSVSAPRRHHGREYCRDWSRDAVEGLGGLDILVNNAARAAVHGESMADLTDEQFDDTFKTNVYAMFWITKAALPHLKPGLDDHQHDVDPGVLAVERSWSTTPRPRPPSTPSPRRWPSSSPRRASA